MVINKSATNETVVNVAIATTYPGAALMCSSIKAEVIDETKDVNSDKRRFLFMSYFLLSCCLVWFNVSRRGIPGENRTHSTTSFWDGGTTGRSTNRFSSQGQST